MPTTVAARRVPLLGLAALIAAAPSPAPVAAAGNAPGSSPVTLTQPTGAGLAVTGPLAGMRAGAATRVLLPDRWRRAGTTADGHLRLVVGQNGSCTFDVSYSVTSEIIAGAASGAIAQARVIELLPARSSAYVLDGGVRGNAAFRVVRRPRSNGRVFVDARWTGLLTRRPDIAPAGSTAWATVRVTAHSRSGSECHAGTYRESLGPAIGDSLAVARTRLRFTGRPTRGRSAS